GTDTAFTVVVRDTLPLDLDVRTFEAGASIHPYTYSLTGDGILTFTFTNILLPDSNTNEPLSHGLVNFRLRPLFPLNLGQEITNVADIYFDFNTPIRTPDATVIVTNATKVSAEVETSQLVVFPVPARNLVTALAPDGFTPVQALAFGGDGRNVPLPITFGPGAQLQIPIQHLAPGPYVLTLRARDGRTLSARFTKE
ncbi:MAG: hypothetical protein IT229_11440, partial [Flavobacteriales bacterium]|nr:hypothetical protein [Flavobacteriales bacterium]